MTNTIIILSQHLYVSINIEVIYIYILNLEIEEKGNRSESKFYSYTIFIYIRSNVEITTAAVIVLHFIHAYFCNFYCCLFYHSYRVVVSGDDFFDHVVVVVTATAAGCSMTEAITAAHYQSDMCSSLTLSHFSCYPTTRFW